MLVAEEQSGVAAGGPLGGPWGPLGASSKPTLVNQRKRCLKINLSRQQQRLTHAWEAGEGVVGEGEGPLVREERWWGGRCRDVEDRTRRDTMLGLDRGPLVLSSAWQARIVVFRISSKIVRTGGVILTVGSSASGWGGPTGSRHF